VSFPITFGFEKVVKARVDLGGEFRFQLFEPYTVRDEIGGGGISLCRNSQKILLECLEYEIFRLGKGHS
jgi:hypothetical protein